MTDLKWYVIQTKARDEVRCVMELSRKGIESLCPMAREYRWRRRIYEAVPLFPGYVFALFNYTDSYYQVKWTPGIKKLVQFGEAPTCLEDSIVDEMKSSMDDRGIIDLAPDVHEGDKIRFRFGPLKGLMGTVLRCHSAQERVVVLMDHLSYQAKLKVDRHQVCLV
jgi:transcriptional antiterminator RfaH